VSRCLRVFLGVFLWFACTDDPSIINSLIFWILICNRCALSIVMWLGSLVCMICAIGSEMLSLGRGMGYLGRYSAEKVVNERLSQTPELYILALAQFASTASEDVNTICPLLSLTEAMSDYLCRCVLFRLSFFDVYSSVLSKVHPMHPLSAQDITNKVNHSLCTTISLNPHACNSRIHC